MLRRYHRPRPPLDDSVVDFLGASTAVRYNSATAHLSGVVEGIPYQSNFHSEAIEWIGLLRSVDEAGECYAIAELGAGWGPWLVAGGVAARSKGLSDIRMVGVEADAGHFEFIRDHLLRKRLRS